MTQFPSDNPQGKSCETFMREADALMAQKRWPEARAAYIAARDAAISELDNLGDSDEGRERRASLKKQLEILNENDSDYGRIAIADDYRRRISAFKEWIRKRPESILNLRYQLALNSLPERLRPTVIHVIETIAEREQAEKDEVANIVFAYLTHIFHTIDPDNEEGFIDICIKLPNDESYTNDRRLTRPNNRLAAEERIIGRAAGILRKDNSEKLIKNNKEEFEGLTRDVLNFMEIRESDKLWQIGADGILQAIREGEAAMPPDHD